MQEFNLTYHIVLFFAWIGYVGLHSLLAANFFKAWIQRVMGSNYKYYRLSYSIFAALSLALILVYQFTSPSPVLFDELLFVKIAGGMFALVGLAGMAVCIRKYFMNLSGVDVLMKQKREAVLEISGLHRLVRHPLYSTTLTFCWGLFLMFPFVDNLIACAVITIYTLIGIRFEEIKLVEEFGENYRHYSKITPMLIPDFKKLSPKNA